MSKHQLLGRLILLPLAALPVGILPHAADAQVVTDKSLLAPERTVISVRLEGNFYDAAYDYVFEPLAPNSVRFRALRKGTNTEVGRGILEGDASAGLMRGETRFPDVNYVTGYFRGQMKSWIDDSGALYIDGGMPFSTPRYLRSAAQPTTAAAKAWTGKWQTNRGLLTVAADGFNFVAWITQPGSSKKDRVAFRATAAEAVGAWDSEWDRQGVWRHVPMQWGDLKLTLSADGNSFKGIYTTTKATMGLERREWTGERVNKLPVASPTPSRPTVPSPGPVPNPVPVANETHSPPNPPASPPMPPDPPAMQVGFKHLQAFDVRLDKVAAEDGRFWHVYMTLRNASSDTLVQAQGLTVRFEDSDGVGVESGQAVRARIGYPELFGSPPPTTRPGGTLPVKFVFDKKGGARPSKVTVYEGEKSVEFGF